MYTYIHMYFLLSKKGKDGWCEEKEKKKKKSELH